MEQGDPIRSAIREIVREEVKAAMRPLLLLHQNLENTLRRQGFYLYRDGMCLNSDRAAEYLGLRGGGQVMRTLKAQGKGPRVHKLGRLNVYFLADLDEWISEHAKPV